jgi:hypothetical protein
MNYVCVVGFETDKIDKETGNPKVKKARFLVNGESLYEALMNMMEYLKEDSRGYDIKSIAEAKYEDIIKEKSGKKVVAQA